MPITLRQINFRKELISSKSFKNISSESDIGSQSKNVWLLSSFLSTQKRFVPSFLGTIKTGEQKGDSEGLTILIFQHFTYLPVDTFLHLVWYMSIFTGKGFALTILISCSKTYAIPVLIWSTSLKFCRKHVLISSYLFFLFCFVDKLGLMSTSSLLICGYLTSQLCFLRFIFRTVNNRCTD